MAAPVSAGVPVNGRRLEEVERRLELAQGVLSQLTARQDRVLGLEAAAPVLEELARRSEALLTLERGLDEEADIRGRDVAAVSRRVAALEECRRALDRLDLPRLREEVDELGPIVRRQEEEIRVLFEDVGSAQARIEALRALPGEIVEIEAKLPEAEEADVRRVIAEITAEETVELRRLVNDLGERVDSFRRRVGEISGFQAETNRLRQEVEGLRMTLEGLPGRTELLDIRRRLLRENEDLRRRVGRVERRLGLEGEGPGAPPAPPPTVPPAAPRPGRRARELGLAPPPG